MASRPHQTVSWKVIVVGEILVLAIAISVVLDGQVGLGIYIGAIALAGIAIALVRLRRLR